MKIDLGIFLIIFSFVVEREKRPRKGSLAGTLVLRRGGIISDVSIPPTRKGSIRSSQIHDEFDTRLSVYTSLFVAKTTQIRVLQVIFKKGYLSYNEVPAGGIQYESSNTLTLRGGFTPESGRCFLSALTTSHPQLPPRAPW